MSNKSTNWGVMESVAAIAMNMGESKKKGAAYDAATDSMGGFPGFYQTAVEMGISLEGYAEAHKIIWGEGADWINTSDQVAERLLEFMIDNGRLPLADERTEIIKANIAAF
jgi:hypothetical protein